MFNFSVDSEQERTRYWLACIDHPVARPTYTFRITASKGTRTTTAQIIDLVIEYTILASGKEVSTAEVDAERKTSTWVLDRSCPSYAVCLAVGDFIFGTLTN